MPHLIVPDHQPVAADVLGRRRFPIVGRLFSVLAVLCVAAGCHRPLAPGAEADAAIATSSWLEEHYGVNDSPLVTREISHVTDCLASADVGRALEREASWALPPEERPARWQVIVIRAREPNAFSLGAGIIVVTEGLLLEARSEAELAAVISHEMAHQILGHTRRALAALPQTTAAPGVGPNVPAVQHSLDDEVAADALGLKILYVARYDISHALGALSLGAKDLHGGMPPEWLNHRSAKLAQKIDDIGNFLPATASTRMFTHMQRSLAGLTG